MNVPYKRSSRKLDAQEGCCCCSSCSDTLWPDLVMCRRWTEIALTFSAFTEWLGAVIPFVSWFLDDYLLKRTRRKPVALNFVHGSPLSVVDFNVRRRNWKKFELSLSRRSESSRKMQRKNMDRCMGETWLSLSPIPLGLVDTLMQRDKSACEVLLKCSSARMRSDVTVWLERRTETQMMCSQDCFASLKCSRFLGLDHDCLRLCMTRSF